MQQVPDYGDDRNKGFCVHCGGGSETRDHMPSKIFLDEPLPENLPVSPACFNCNNGFSLDEEYLACLLECICLGDVDPDRVERPKIARILRGNASLSTRLRTARTEVNDQAVWSYEQHRVRRVLLKLSRGHAAYELNEPQLGEPEVFSFKPLVLMTDRERREFEEDDAGDIAVWPEVGSRAMNRMFVHGANAYDEGWLVVQKGRYRYRTSQPGVMRIRLVIREYLACDVIW